MPFRLRTLSRAHRDMAQIINWMVKERQAKSGAARWLTAYETAARAAARNPASYPLAPECDEDEREIRQFLFKTRSGKVYRALFLIERDEVVVLRIRGPGQPPLTPDELR